MSTPLFPPCVLIVGSADGRPAEHAGRCRVSKKASSQTEGKRERFCKYKMVKNPKGDYFYLKQG